MTASPLRSLFLLIAICIASSMAQYEGVWKIQTAFENNQERADLIPVTKTNGGVSFFIDKADGENKYTIKTRVANRMSTEFTVLNDQGDIEVGPVASTKMLPPPEQRPMENYLTSHLPEMTKITVDGNYLTFYDGNSKMFWSNLNSLNNKKDGTTSGNNLAFNAGVSQNYRMQRVRLVQLSRELFKP